MLLVDLYQSVCVCVCFAAVLHDMLGGSCSQFWVSVLFLISVVILTA